MIVAVGIRRQFDLDERRHTKAMIPPFWVSRYSMAAGAVLGSESRNKGCCPDRSQPALNVVRKSLGAVCNIAQNARPKRVRGIAPSIDRRVCRSITIGSFRFRRTWQLREPDRVLVRAASPFAAPKRVEKSRQLRASRLAMDRIRRLRFVLAGGEDF